MGMDMLHLKRTIGGYGGFVVAGALRLGALRLGTTAPLSVVRESVLASGGVQIRKPGEEGQA